MPADTISDRDLLAQSRVIYRDDDFEEAKAVEAAQGSGVAVRMCRTVFSGPGATAAGGASPQQQQEFVCSTACCPSTATGLPGWNWTPS